MEGLTSERRLMHAFLFPSKQGSKPGPLLWDLWTFRPGGVYELIVALFYLFVHGFSGLPI